MFHTCNFWRTTVSRQTSGPTSRPSLTLERRSLGRLRRRRDCTSRRGWFSATAGPFNAGKSTVRRWSSVALRAVVIARLLRSSTGTLRASVGDVTPAIWPQSQASLTLVAVAARRVFACDAKRTRGALLAYAMREPCACGGKGCDWTHYFFRCTLLEQQQSALVRVLEEGAGHML